MKLFLEHLEKYYPFWMILSLALLDFLIPSLFLMLCLFGIMFLWSTRYKSR